MEIKASVVVTVLNEEDNILKLLNSLLNQSHVPDEIIIVDGGSTDSTVEKIRSVMKDNKLIKLILKKCSRSEGRNIGIRKAKNNIILLTDAGCWADINWIKNISKPFRNSANQIVAGFYKMETSNSFEKAQSVFLGVLPQNLNKSYLPSARSMAFLKSVWSRVGGFNESLNGAGEDTEFVLRLTKEKIKIVLASEAIVYWQLPKSMKDFFKSVKNYAEGDAKSKIYWHDTKKMSSHNIKAIFIIIRYLLGFFLFVYSFYYFPAIFYLGALFMFVFVFTFFKVFRLTGSFKSGLWGIVLRLVSDAGVIIGFFKGTF